MGWRELRLALEKAVQVLGRLETAPIGAFGEYCELARGLSADDCELVIETGKKPVGLTKDILPISAGR